MKASVSLPRPQVRTFAQATDLDRALCQSVSECLEGAIKLRGKATLVVSGGSTPLGFLRLMAQQQLPWSQVLVTLADERWVPVQHADSNERMVREHLIDHTGAQFLSLRGVESSSIQAQQRLQEQMLGNDQFDVVILGMGTDGHTASLFPQAADLATLLDVHNPNCCAVVDPITAPHQRLSLTLSRLLNSRSIILHVTGSSKREVLERAWATQSLPIAAVLRQELVPLEIYIDQPLELA